MKRIANEIVGIKTCMQRKAKYLNINLFIHLQYKYLFSNRAAFLYKRRWAATSVEHSPIDGCVI